MPKHWFGFIRLRAAAVALSALALPSIASADIITFSGLAGANSTPFTTYSEAGFTVSLVEGLICDAQAFGNPIPDLFGGPTCGVTTTSTLSVTRTGGGSFTFAGADLASNNGSSAYFYTGFVGGSSVYSSFNNFNFGTSVFSTVANPSSSIFVSEVRIRLTSNDASSFNIDNIGVTAAATTTPEPGTLGLLGIGLAGFGIVTRRRKSK